MERIQILRWCGARTAVRVFPVCLGLAPDIGMESNRQQEPAKIGAEFERARVLDET